VACGWSVTDDRITVTVAVPPGSTALLELPTADADSVRESGGPATQQPGVLAIEPTAAGATVRLSSGGYTFSALHA
jgi:alpha-L-rhamnosidase